MKCIQGVTASLMLREVKFGGKRILDASFWFNLFHFKCIIYWLIFVWSLWYLQASSTSPKTRPAETTTSCNSKPLTSTSRSNPMTSFKRPSISDAKVGIMMMGQVQGQKLQQRIWMWRGMWIRVKNCLQCFALDMQCPLLPPLRWCFSPFIYLQLKLKVVSFFYDQLSMVCLFVWFDYIASQVLQLQCTSHLLFQP